jgi:hypothetical protein
MTFVNRLNDVTSKDYELGMIFNPEHHTNKLPVSIIINNVRHNHIFEEEIIVGILLFIYLTHPTIQIFDAL